MGSEKTGVLLRLLLAVHLLAAHATTPDAVAAAPSSRWASGPAAPGRAPGGLGAVIRGALGALGGLYAHSPLRGGRRDETPRTRSTRPRVTRGAADKEPGADANARGAAHAASPPAICAGEPFSAYCCSVFSVFFSIMM